MNGWMWLLTEAEAIYRGAPRSKGAANWAQNGLGRSAWAHFRPGSARPSSTLLFKLTRIYAELLVGPWRCFSRDLDKGTWRVNSRIFCLGPRSFTASCFSPRVVWSHIHHVSWLVLGFMISSKLLDELILKLSSLTLISRINNKLQKLHASVNLLHHYSLVCLVAG
jgi:hypothetical protein